MAGTDRRIHLDKTPRYGLMMSMVAICLFLITFGGQFHLFGIFGEDMILREDY